MKNFIDLGLTDKMLIKQMWQCYYSSAIRHNQNIDYEEIQLHFAEYIEQHFNIEIQDKHLNKLG